MALPIYLGLGMVSIYGAGVTTSRHGYRMTPNQFKFGTIYQIADDITNNYVGDRVMFKEADVKFRLLVAGGPQYTFVEGGKLIITEY
jgi:hypothetical protein